MKSLIYLTLTITIIILSNMNNNLSFADNVAAVVGNKKIMESELDIFTEKIPEPFKNSFKTKALENLIDNQVFSQLALKEGLDKDSDFVSALNKAKEKMLADFYIEKKIISKINITDKDIEEYYQRHISEYSGKLKIHVAHISTSSMKDAVKIKDLLNNGLVFDVLMADRSGRYGEFAGGDLGWLERGRMPTAFEEMAFSLKKDEISEIVKTSIGFHIIKMINRKQDTMKSLGEVAPQIKEKLFKKELDRLKNLQRKKIIVQIIK